MKYLGLILLSFSTQEFESIDKNGGGQILFAEFVDWALSKNLDLEDDED